MINLLTWSTADWRAKNVVNAGAIESESRFDSASEIAAKAIVSIDLVALTCSTISLAHIKIDLGPGPAITIVHGDHEGHRRGQSRQLCR